MTGLNPLRPSVPSTRQSAISSDATVSSQEVGHNAELRSGNGANHPGTVAVRSAGDKKTSFVDKFCQGVIDTYKSWLRPFVAVIGFITGNRTFAVAGGRSHRPSRTEHNDLLWRFNNYLNPHPTVHPNMHAVFEQLGINLPQTRDSATILFFLENKLQSGEIGQDRAGNFFAVDPPAVDSFIERDSFSETGDDDTHTANDRLPGRNTMHPTSPPADFDANSDTARNTISPESSSFRLESDNDD